MCIERAAEALNIAMEGARVAVQGFGNAGEVVATLLHERGARIVAVSDTKGGIYSETGFDPRSVKEFKDRSPKHDQEQRKGTVVGFPGAHAITNDAVLEAPCDILIPAAVANQITGANAAKIQARLIAEAANGPTTTEADDILYRKGVTLLPNILANAGGITVSYFEWVQNLQGLRWDLEETDQRLRKLMSAAYEHVAATATEYQVDLRTGATILAVQRVALATELRGV
jgi:glutamate dehydrogenase (NAD(P)+)